MGETPPSPQQFAVKAEHPQTAGLVRACAPLKCIEVGIVCIFAAAACIA